MTIFAAATAPRNERTKLGHAPIPLVTRTKAQQELKDAVERVYRKYGNDLPRFYEDVKKEIQIKQGA
jgi:hypothetical protein